MKFSQDQSLLHYNTFGINVKANLLVECSSENELKYVLNSNEAKLNSCLILGGGSNVLFTQDYDGLVIINRLKGIATEPFNDEKLMVTAQAGEVWNDLVSYTTENGYGGIENLALIPGMVGAAPIQNIGAYGVELQDVFMSLEAIDVNSGETRTFTKNECEFGYRNSIFKKSLKNKYIITSISILLDRTPVPNTNYETLSSTLEMMKISEPTITDVRNAVIQIRQQKLPDPAVLGNAGSFFKNPVIDNIDFESLQLEYENIPGYKIGPDLMKVSAAWLIEQCGWKGKKTGHVGVHTNQALVLVNYGDGVGTELIDLSEKIQESVHNKFGIILEREVTVIP